MPRCSLPGNVQDEPWRALAQEAGSVLGYRARHGPGDVGKEEQA